MLIHFCLPSNIGYRKRENVYLKHSLHAKFKIHVRQENGVNAEEKRGVTNDVMFASPHEKINSLLSVLSIFFFSFFFFFFFFFFFII